MSGSLFQVWCFFCLICLITLVMRSGMVVVMWGEHLMGDRWGAHKPQAVRFQKQREQQRDEAEYHWLACGDMQPPKQNRLFIVVMSSCVKQALDPVLLQQEKEKAVVIACCCLPQVSGHVLCRQRSWSSNCKWKGPRHQHRILSLASC